MVGSELAQGLQEDLIPFQGNISPTIFTNTGASRIGRRIGLRLKGVQDPVELVACEECLRQKLFAEDTEIASEEDRQAIIVS